MPRFARRFSTTRKMLAFTVSHGREGDEEMERWTSPVDIVRAWTETIPSYIAAAADGAWLGFRLRVRRGTKLMKLRREKIRWQPVIFIAHKALKR